MLIDQFFIMSSRGDTIISRGSTGAEAGRLAARRFFQHLCSVDSKLAKRDTVSSSGSTTTGGSSGAASSSSGSVGASEPSSDSIEEGLGEEQSQAAPIFNDEGISYISSFNNGIYFVATTRYNVSPALVLEILDRFSHIFKDYCGELHEESVRKNFVLIYELLDEALDWGCPQNTDTEALKGYVNSEPVSTKSFNLAQKLEALVHKKTKSTTATMKPVAVSFSKDRVQKNELFVDLLERVTAIFSGSGAVVKGEIDGCVVMKSYLKGEPMLHIALTDREHSGARAPIEFQDINFHHAIGPQDFMSTRALSFAPPAGEFIALNYRLSTTRLPFRIQPHMEGSLKYRTQITLIVKVTADLPSTLSATDVLVTVPVPETTVSVSSELGYAATSMGERAEFHKTHGLYIWSIPSFPGQTEHVLKATVFLNRPYVRSTFKEIGPISISFEIPMYTCSGLEIRQLRLAERAQTYEAARWIRYITQSRSYICRPL